MNSLERAIRLSPEAMEPYDAVLTGLNLPPDRLQRLRELMVERMESAQDAERFSKEAGLDPEATSAIREDAEGFLDRSIADLVGSPNDRVIRRMLAVTPQLAEIARTVGRDLDRNGEPLTGHQALQLAQIYNDTYSALPPDRPATPSLRTAGFDSQSGLAAIDRLALDRAGTLLTAGQLAILQADLAKKTGALAQAGR